MHSFDNAEHQKREMAELEKNKEELTHLPADIMKPEIEHIFATIALAEQAVHKGWYSLYACHKATIAAGMDLLFARLTADL